MKISELLHSSPKVAFLGKSLQIAVCAPADIEISDSALTLSASLASASTEVALLFKCDFALADKAFKIYSAVIPAAFIRTSGILSYVIKLNGEELSAYKCQVVNVSGLPPLYISEAALSLRGTGLSAFVEITNITAEAIDLYDYELLIFETHDHLNATIKRNPLSENKGENILGAGKSIAIRYLVPKGKEPDHAQYMGKEGFCLACNEDYCFARGYNPISVESVNLVDIDLCELNEKGKWKIKSPMSKFLKGVLPQTMALVPRGEGFEKAVYVIYLNKDRDDYDFRTKRSSLWRVDLMNPTIASPVRHSTTPTPTGLDRLQAIPDFTDILPPVIIPDPVASYVYLKDGSFRLTYAVIDKTVTDTGICLITPNGSVEKIYAEPSGEENLYSVTVTQAQLRRLKRLSFYYFAEDSLRESLLGSVENPFTVNIYDDEGPILLSALPTEQYCYEVENGGTIEIKGRYFDISGVKTSACILCIDKKNISSSVKWTESGFSCKLKGLKRGIHKFELALFDNLGNHSYTAYNFSICDGKELNFYHGEVHSHCGDSDGCATAQEAMKYARDVAGVDFFAVTDHSHQFNACEYAEQIKTANEYNTPGEFAALYGWEMSWGGTSGYWGHMNVLNTEWYEKYLFDVSMPELFKKLESDPDAVAMFNHPGYNWGNFDEFSFINDAIREQLCLLELKGINHSLEYMHALNKGWRVSPMFNGDDHNLMWTNNHSATSVILAPALTRENVIDAFRKRRTYSTCDPTLKLSYKINGEWLGSTLQDPESLEFDISMTTESPEGIGRISIIAQDGIEVAAMDAGVRQSIIWRPSLTPEFRYYYIKIMNGDNFTFSAPIWIEKTETIEISELDIAASLVPEKPYCVHVGLKNHSGGTVSGARLDFYVSDETGFDLGASVPYTTAYVSKITAGNSADVYVNLPVISNKCRVSVVAHAISTQSGKKKLSSDTRFTVLTPVIITSIMPLSSEYVTECGAIENPFPYVTLYNTTCNPVDLSNYTIRLKRNSGVPVEEAATLRLENVTIKPFSSLVIWRNPKKSGLTVKDFNERYSCSLVENESIIATDKKLITPILRNTYAVELLDGERLVSRVKYNFGIEFGHTALVADEERLYRFKASTRATSEYYAQGVDVIPGTVYDEQKPRIMISSPKYGVGRIGKRFEKNARKAEKKTQRSALGFIGLAAAGLGAAAGAALLAYRMARKKQAIDSQATPGALKLTSAVSVTKKRTRVRNGVTDTIEKTKLSLKAKPPKKDGTAPKREGGAKKPARSKTRKRPSKPISPEKVVKKSRKNGILQPTPQTPQTPTHK